MCALLTLLTAGRPLVLHATFHLKLLALSLLCGFAVHVQ